MSGLVLSLAEAGSRSPRRTAGSPDGASVIGLLLLSMLPLGLGGCRMSASDPDPLSSELRARVEHLKLEARQSSTNPQVLRQRLEVLWDWSNAYALSGGAIPPDFPANFGVAYRATRGLDAPMPKRLAAELIDAEGKISMELISVFVANRVREFQIKEESPEAFGVLTLSASGPFEAGEYVTLEQTYTLGEMAMAPGSGFMLANRRGASFQVSDPEAAGYTTVRCSRAGARLVPEPPADRWLSPQTSPEAVYRIEGATLEPGDTITITYGDRVGGSAGMRVPVASVDEVFLPFYVDPEGSGNMMRPAWPTFSVDGVSEPRFVNGVVPSVVEPGEPFALAIRSEDRFKNPVGGGVPAYDVLLAGKTLASVPAGDEAVRLLELSLPEPGAYRFEIRSRDGALSGRTNPVLVREDPTHRIYWGDTHGHTNFAEGRGSPDAYFRFGRDIARLDFLTLSEHDIWTDAREWQVMQEKTEQYLDPGRFTTILGYEYTAFYWAGGHHNVYFRTTRGRERVSHQQVLSLGELYAGLAEIHRPEDVLIIPHAHMPGDWRQSDARMERLVEISSGHGSWEWFGNRYLANGFRVGFIGSSDNHSTHPGYSVGTNRQLGGLAAVLAPNNGREELFEALRSRSCYATTGERIVLEATLNGVRMGQEVPGTRRRRIESRVFGTQPIDTVQLIKNGEVVYTKRYLGAGLEEHSWVQVVLESSSELFGEYRGPSRRQRDWRGSMEVTNGRLESFELPWYLDPKTDHFERSEADPNRIVFSFNTRGRGKGVLLEISGASPSTEVVVHLDELVSGRRQILPREPEHLSEEHLVYRLGDLAAGAIGRELAVGENIDRVEAQLTSGAGALDQEFEFTDLGDNGPGDYYYLRVRQIDGSMAWSSPFWLGSPPATPASD